MAAYQGAIVFLKTQSGSVPAVTTAHKSAGVAADVAVGSATTVDIVTIGYDGTRLTGVTVAAATTSFAGRLTVTAGQVFIPA